MLCAFVRRPSRPSDAPTWLRANAEGSLGTALAISRSSHHVLVFLSALVCHAYVQVLIVLPKSCSWLVHIGIFEKHCHGAIICGSDKDIFDRILRVVSLCFEAQLFCFFCSFELVRPAGGTEFINRVMQRAIGKKTGLAGHVSLVTALVAAILARMSGLAWCQAPPSLPRARTCALQCPESAGPLWPALARFV